MGVRPPDVARKKRAIGVDGRVYAEIAKFYGIHPVPWADGAMGRLVAVALAENMPRLRAREQLEEALAGRVEMSPEELRRIAFDATGSEEVAQIYFEQATIAEMNRRRAMRQQD